MGEDKFSRFVQQLGPKLYARLAKKNVKNLNAAYRNAMLQLALESDYGNSPVARKQHNYGGYGYNGSTYTTFKDDDSFLDAYTDLITGRYRDAVNSADLKGFATNLKKKGYYLDSLENYYGKLSGMTSMAKAIDNHMSLNPDIYSFASQPIPANLQYVHQPVSTRVAPRPERTYLGGELPELVVTGKRPKLTLPSISLSLELAMAKLLLSASGFNPDMPMWELYAPTYRPLVMPQHYEDGTEGNLPTQNFGDWQKGWLRNRRKQIQENALSFVESMPGLESLSPELKLDMILEAESYMYPGLHPEIQQRTPVLNEKIKSIQLKYGYMPSHISPMSPQIDQDQYLKEYDHLLNFRYLYGLDPTKTITPDMIKKWRLDGTLSKENYNFYPDEMLLEYFNEVAANPTGGLKKKWVNRAFGPNRAKLIIGPHYANIKTPRFVLV